jgi:hypothetical protein
MNSSAPSVLLLALSSFLPLSALAQAPGTGLEDLPACTLQGRNYRCSKPNLQQVLAAAHTVALVSQPANHASDAALASLAKALDKTVVLASSQQTADLTLRLTPIEPAGVSVGMGATDLAMLNIFLAAPGDPTHKLLWSETYNGDPNLPWPSVVNALTRQFKSHLGIH